MKAVEMLLNLKAKTSRKWAKVHCNMVV